MGGSSTKQRKRALSVGDSNRLVFKTNSIGDDYTMIKSVGEGANGKVFLCTRKNDKKKYALKRLVDNKNSRREIELQWRASLNCNYIVKIQDVYENRDRGQKYLYLIMEYMEGGELFDRLKKKKKFTELEVAKIMVQICKAVHHLHSMGIAHRDLKPENLLLKSKDTTLIKLSDFGFAKEASSGLFTPNYTPYYAPPEILSFEKYDISCDIWSLGVIMYILCCGYPPFYSTHDKPLSPGMKKRIINGQYEFPPADWLNVSDDAKKLIVGMLETIPEKRLTITQILNSSWIKNYTNASKVRLNSIKILKKEQNNWQEYIGNMNQALEEMRVNYDRKLNIKPLETSNNPLYKRRHEKNQQSIKSKKQTADKTPPPALKIDIKQPAAETLDDKRQRSLKRVASLPNPKTPIVAFYYTSNLKYCEEVDIFSNSYD